MRGGKTMLWVDCDIYTWALKTRQRSKANVVNALELFKASLEVGITQVACMHVRLSALTV
jgi:hypothetical protein